MYQPTRTELVHALGAMVAIVRRYMIAHHASETTVTLVKHAEQVLECEYGVDLPPGIEVEEVRS